MAKKNKLELTWIGKDERPRLEPRILIEQPELSYHAQSRREGDYFDNMLIHGDNLLALKALETDPDVRGKVKCIFIDPPYNTGSAFEHYDDGIEHSLWLTMMRDRLVILRDLLSEDGSIWVTLDDNEAHYFKVMADAVLGRKNFIANVIWEKSDSPRMDATHFSSRHDHILVYAKSAEVFRLNKKAISIDEVPGHYNRMSGDGRSYYTKPLRAMGAADTRKERPSLYFAMKSPDGDEVYPIRKDGVEGRWRWSKERVEKDADLIEWVKGRSGWTPYYRIYADNKALRPPETIWTHSEVGSNRTSKLEIKQVFEGVKDFQTPKPEKLLARIIGLASDVGDIVLDSFAGSGTTGAVAHKMGRRWIMVELGEHAKTHIVPRMQKVIDGSDKGGITEAVDWRGGGGFRFYKLAPSMLEKDKWGNLVINKSYNAEMLAEAMCKHFNYSYAPSAEHYWMHGFATENAFIYVTTNSLTFEQLKVISDEVGEHRSLLVCCMAYEAAGESLTNLTIKKIPRVVLGRCEWGKDDYSLKIAALPEREPETEEAEAAPGKIKKAKKVVAQAGLFDGSEE